ncbi:MAG: AAA family ATPase [Deltaproteobacteria bacterium]|jgi:hypothetical protein|nr:AAA family ATPase [Deltaproteobacteria bacterium]
MTKQQGKVLVQNSVFSDFITQNSPLVDKTKLVMQLLQEPMGSYLLCRPRRFDKTLLLDTIENIFRGERELFKNLAIGQPGVKFDWEVLPVIRLYMSGTHSSVRGLKQDLIGILSDIAEDQHVQIDTTNETRAISTLIRRVSDKHVAYAEENDIKISKTSPRNVVLLIDEYDFPLQVNLLDFDKTIKLKILLRVFFSAIKRLQNRIRFCLISGITKFDELSLSSGMNQVEDITYESRYSEICGFTIDEIRTTFSEYLQPSLDEMISRGELGANPTVDRLMGEFERWYDGYSWDGQKRVLNPRSVAECLSKKKFFEYWKSTGPSLMFDQLGIGPENYYNVFLDDLTVEQNVSITETQTIYNDNAVMLMAGYLTVDSIDNSGDAAIYHLRIPNYEIKRVIRNSILARRTSSPKSVDSLGMMNPKYKKFYDAFCHRNEQECEKLFSSFISSASYEYDLTGELFFTFLLSLCLDIGKHKTALEAHTTKGRTDLALLTPDGEWMVIEVKHDNPVRSLKRNKRLEGAKGAKGVAAALSPSKKVAESPEFSQHSEPLAEHPPDRDPDIMHGIHPVSGKAAIDSATQKDLPVVAGEVPETAAISLEKNVSAAFEQIVAKVYSLPFLGRNARVWAVAVAIYDSAFVRIRFRQAVWKDDTRTRVELP